MDRHTPKGSVRTGHGVPCGALPLIKTKKKKNICSDEGLRLQTSALETLYGGQFTLSIRVIKPNYLVTSGSTNATAKIHWVHGKEKKSIF